MNALKFYGLGSLFSWSYFSHHINKEVRENLLRNRTKKTDWNDDIFELTTACAILWPFLLPSHLCGNLQLYVKT
ncbi:hypothetical protein Catovirus_1_405 [Catovirus CTV1]|mgnify:CR=1 FL=1|uniref:Uncharacterized protein n=1 Tax=Catovirus CTV1 TaxID=1977631 RepID=A0A1V0S9G2_9VIRU|nr:hypothetical protein Catovirus_1_405 [Catovirus CTV1]